MTSVHHATPVSSALPASAALALSPRHGARLRIVPVSALIVGQVRRGEAHFLRLLGVRPVHVISDRLARLEVLLRSPDITTAGQLADAMMLSPVQLKRLCRRLYGVTPKSLLIRHRLARMLAALDQRPYGELCHFLDPGYCDQSHFIRDFKTFFGVPPTRYLAAHR